VKTIEVNVDALFTAANSLFGGDAARVLNDLYVVLDKSQRESLSQGYNEGYELGHKDGFKEGFDYGYDQAKGVALLDAPQPVICLPDLSDLDEERLEGYRGQSDAAAK
jgi:hypothetical protein